MSQTVQELAAGFRSFAIQPSQPILAHASLSAFGRVEGGAEALLEALLSVFNTLIMPTFTSRAELIPEEGPPSNGLLYGSGRDLNRLAEPFTSSSRADRLMGAAAERLRCHPRAKRSSHPLLSFCGVQAEAYLQAQTLAEPLGPIGKMAEQGGWVLLLGVDQTANTAIHWAEARAGRKQFIRWALTPAGVAACPGYPGCSDGFEAIAPFLKKREVRSLRIGNALVQAITLAGLLEAVFHCLRANPLALLCDRPDCGRCNAVRAIP